MVQRPQNRAEKRRVIGAQHLKADPVQRLAQLRILPGVVTGHRPDIARIDHQRGPFQSIWQISALRPSKSQTRPKARTRPLVAVATVMSGPIQYSVLVTTISSPLWPDTGTTSPWIFLPTIRRRVLPSVSNTTGARSAPRNSLTRMLNSPVVPRALPLKISTSAS